jgi:hypothetical protein
MGIADCTSAVVVCYFSGSCVKEKCKTLTAKIKFRSAGQKVLLKLKAGWRTAIAVAY